MRNDSRFAGPAFEPFGPGAEFDHVGLALASIAGANCNREITPDPVQRVKLAFLSFHDAPVELVEPMDSNSPVSRLLETGSHLYHLCFRVPDLERAAGEARHHGFHRLGKPAAAPALGGRNIVWLFSKQYGLFELVEAEPSGMPS